MQSKSEGRKRFPRTRVGAAAAVALIAVAGATLAAINRGGDEAPVALSLTVDETLAPDVAEVEGLEDGDEPRATGRLETSDGTATDLVLDELIVAVRSDEELQGFLQRWNGVVLERDEDAAPGEPRDVLVRIDPSTADVARAAQDLQTVEPHLSGELRVSSPETLALLAVAAYETAEHGTEVAPNWLGHSEGIADGTSIEAEDRSQRNAMRWSFMRPGGEMDTGVAAAWQLLLGHERLSNKIDILVVDGGFTPNADFPDDSKIRKASWGDENKKSCTGGTPCPYHGTQVAMTAIGRIDNSYGTAGSGGPVAGRLIAMGVYKDSWRTMRVAKRVVREERPHVVNMSFGMKVSVFKGASANAADRHFRDMVEHGALPIASAGNDGRNVDAETCIAGKCSEATLTVPCESHYVLCVGGLQPDSKWKDGGSNYGTNTGRRTVEIYGPYCTVGMVEPGRSSATATRTVCGTSYSSPFVAGVAMLVKAADPSLGPEQIRTILLDTAHNDGVIIPEVTGGGYQRRINALAAVAKALGVEITPPSVKILQPKANAEYGIGQWLDFRAEATDFAGLSLPVSWHSSIDGALSPKPQTLTFSKPLSVGTHQITARATDSLGVEGSATVTVHVVDSPPEVSIVLPENNDSYYGTTAIKLIGSTLDPDTNGPVPNGQVSWQVKPAGSTASAWEGKGHVAQIPGGTLNPGSYKVHFVEYQSGTYVAEVRTIQVKAVPAGETVPVATIHEPSDGDTFGNGAKVTLKGSGFDAEDGALSGTRFRWTMTDDTGKSTVLCTGSDFSGGSGGGDGGGFKAITNCSEHTVTLETNKPSTTYAIRLEVMDSSGLIGTQSVQVIVNHVVA